MGRVSVLLPVVRVERNIRLIRGIRVILGPDLASLYGVSTKRLNEQVKRNQERFPPDFMFRLSRKEATDLKSQIATSSWGHGGTRSLPTAFTEFGAIMAASVLNSDRAIAVGVFVVRAFVRMRHLNEANAVIEDKLKEIEGRLGGHDHVIHEIVEAIRLLMDPVRAGRRRVLGFRARRR